jgi:hypothetical protein
MIFKGQRDNRTCVNKVYQAIFDRAPHFSEAYCVNSVYRRSTSASFVIQFQTRCVVHGLAKGEGIWVGWRERRRLSIKPRTYHFLLSARVLLLVTSTESWSDFGGPCDPPFFTIQNYSLTSYGPYCDSTHNSLMGRKALAEYGQCREEKKIYQ